MFEIPARTSIAIEMEQFDLCNIGIDCRFTLSSHSRWNLVFAVLPGKFREVVWGPPYVVSRT